MEPTRLSSEGQIVLPKRIRASRDWGPGTEFMIEEIGEGILLRPVGNFPETDIDDVAGCLRSGGKRRTPSQMQTAIDAEVIRRHGRDRY